MKLALAISALAHRNFALFFVGQGLSLIGTWMQQVAMAWLVFVLTGSPFWLGLVGFAGEGSGPNGVIKEKEYCK